MSRILIPVTVPGMHGAAGSEDEPDLEQIEVVEGESLEDIKAKLKPKKASISAEMLDTANTYDDKVAVIRMNRAGYQIARVEQQQRRFP